MSNANEDTGPTVESPPQQTMEEQFLSHLQFIRKNPRSSRNKQATQELESTKAPLFSTDVALHLGRIPSKQYGLLGEEISEPVIDLLTYEVQEKQPNLIYANHSEPWSAFICGVQGSGKSHSLATLVENCLLTDHQIGSVPNPLTAMAFHFDPYSSSYSTQHCELAYFCSTGTNVRILVSPRNLPKMKMHYGNLPNLPAGVKSPEVFPLKLSEKQLNIMSIKALMSFGSSTSVPLYMTVLNSLLDKLNDEQQGEPGIDFQKLKKQLQETNFNADQRAMLDLRMDLLESFLATEDELQYIDAIWTFDPGSLTIVDLSSESIDQATACGLYSICLGHFMSRRCETGRVVILDEAHEVCHWFVLI